MLQHRFVVVTSVLLATSAAARAQASETSAGQFVGTPGLMTVDPMTGGAELVRIKEQGFFTTSPAEVAPSLDAPDFRGQALFYGQSPAPSGPLHVDAFSIGEDWIAANGDGELVVPEGRWIGLLFSVTRATPAVGTGAVASEVLAPDGAAGDLFSYEIHTDPAGGPLQEGVYRALDSTQIRLPGGSANMTAFDVFVAQHAFSEFRTRRSPTVYFSVTAATAANLPLGWCGVAANRNGATIFRTTWRPGTPGRWSPPSVYLTGDALGLPAGSDVDALAVDTMHYPSHYILFSTTNPGAGPRIRFHRRGSIGSVQYRFPGSGGPVENRLGIGTGDVDALCATDPGAFEPCQNYTGHRVDLAPTPWSWPNWPNGWAQLGDLSATVHRQPGSLDLHLNCGSDHPTGVFSLWMREPDLPGAPLTSLGPMMRNGIFRGWPALHAHAMSWPPQHRRLQFGVEEYRPATGQTIASPLMEITEWAEVQTKVSAPSPFAASDGSSSGNIWRGTLNRVQCLYDTSHFTDQGTQTRMVIDELEWRMAGGGVQNQNHYPLVHLYMGYSEHDHAAAVTDFASNYHLGQQTLVYSGPVTVEMGWGISPNRHAVRVPLSTPFVYDPTLGRDLVLEIEIAAPPYTPAPPGVANNVVSSSFDVAQHRANTIRSLGTNSATVGVQSAFCPVVRFGYIEDPDTASHEPYGSGCYEDRASFYELFPGTGFDLNGAGATATTSIRLTPASGGFAVGSGTNAWHTPSSAPLALGDDTRVVYALPSTFAWPGGTTGSLSICSNGFVAPNNAVGPSPYVPTAAGLLAANEPRFCLAWTDLNPSPATGGGTVHADTVGNTVVVTWLNVWVFGTAGAHTATMQLVIDCGTGAVEYRWQGCSLTLATLVGWSPGTGGVDPGSRDLDDVPFVCAPDREAMRLTASPRPILGQTIGYEATNVDANAQAAILLMGLDDVDPGIDLDFAGMPGCRLYTPFFHTPNMILSPGVATLGYTLPVTASLSGIAIDAQAAAYVPGINSLQAVVSNALVSVVGLQ